MSRHENGFSLIEVVISIAILGILVVGILSALGTGFKVLSQTDERETAKNLLEGQMESIAQQSYRADGQYTLTVPPEYSGYTLRLEPAVDTLSSDNDTAHLQKITIVATHTVGGKQYSLVDYKVSR